MLWEEKKIKIKKNINYNKNQNSIKKNYIKLLQVVGCIKIGRAEKEKEKNRRMKKNVNNLKMGN